MSSENPEPIDFGKLSIGQFVSRAPVGFTLAILGAVFAAGFTAATFLRVQIYEPELKRTLATEAGSSSMATAATTRELVAIDGEPTYMSTGNPFKVHQSDRAGNIQSTLSPSSFTSNNPIWSPPGATWHIQDQGKRCVLTYVSRVSSNSSRFTLKC